MSRRQKQNALYTRALGVGLGISLVVHAAVLALGRFSGEHEAPRTLTSVRLSEPEVTTERVEPRENDASVETAASPAEAALIAWRPAEVIEPGPAESTATPDLSEASIVANASAARVIAPLIPRPRIAPAENEQGFTPVRVEPPTWMLADGKASGGRSVGGGIRVSAGSGGDCAPGAAILRRFPNRSAVRRIAGGRW